MRKFNTLCATETVTELIETRQKVMEAIRKFSQHCQQRGISQIPNGAWGSVTKTKSEQNKILSFDGLHLVSLSHCKILNVLFLVGTFIYLHNAKTVSAPMLQLKFLRFIAKILK